MKLALAALALGIAFGVSAPVIADTKSLSPIKSETEFVERVAGRDLTIFGIRVSVTPDGRIDGRAYGVPVSGRWQWQDGFFCRDLFWGKRDLGANCQEVRIDGNMVRFTSDRGTGQFADLRIR